ncbi:MAG: TSUP family transporter [Clostridiales bacterium]|nr:TSUP family transporter [Clostridiales bacterium]
MRWLTALAAGTVTGILSGWGVGGGTLLLLYMTLFAGLEQRVAQGINLLYFLPAASAALPAHLRNGFVDRRAARPAIAAGLVCCAVSAWVSTGLDVTLLRKCFGVFLLLVGTHELLRR